MMILAEDTRHGCWPLGLPGEGVGRGRYATERLAIDSAINTTHIYAIHIILANRYVLQYSVILRRHYDIHYNADPYTR